MKKNNLINVAIQVLPEADGKTKYELVDAAIAVITGSGLKYRVCPFETVVECTLEQALLLIPEIHEACRTAGTDRMLTYLKIQTDFNSDVTIEDKMEKYD